MSAIEEVGARVVLLGRAQAAAAAKEMRSSLASISDQTKATNAAVAASMQDVAAAQTKAATATKAYADARADLAAKVTAANDALAAGDTEAATAAKAEADAQRLVTKSLQDQAIAARAAAASARQNLASVKASTAAADITTASTGMLTKSLGALSSVGKYAFLGTAAAATYLGVEGVKRMSSFNDQITRLGTLANVPTTTLPELSKWAQQNSPALLESVGTIADQMYRIASANSGLKLTTQQLENMTKAAAQLSILGGPLTDPEQTARVFGILSANGGLGLGTDYQKIGATASAIVGSGDMTMNDLIDVLGKGHLAPTAAQYGISFGQLGAIIANMGDLGINGSIAGNTIQHALTLMGTPVTKKALDNYADIGLNPNAIGMAFRNKDAMAGLNLLYQHLTGPLDKFMSGQQLQMGVEDIGSKVGLTPAQEKQLATVGAGGMGKLGQQIVSSLVYSMFGGAKQGAGVLALVDTIPREGAKAAEINKTVADSQAKVNAQYHTADAVFKRWDLDLQQVENRIGVYLLPKIIALGDWIKKHQTLVENLAKVIGVVLVSAMLLWIGTMIVANIEMIGVTLAIAAIVIGIYELWTHWDQIWTWMGEHKRYAAIILIAGLILAPFLTIPIVLAGIATHWQTFWTDIEKYTGDGVNQIINIINDFSKLINSALGWAGVKIPMIAQVTWGYSQQKIAGEGKGISANNARMMATGGLVTNHPMAIVGEGNPAFPEFVIPTDPAYRKRALGLYASLGTQLLAGGGSIWGEIGSVAKSVVDPFGIAGKAAHLVAGVALGPAKTAALAAANLLPSGMIRQLADGLITKIFSWAGGMGGGSAPPAGNVTGVAALGKQMAAARGWTGAQWDALNAVAMRESGWNPYAVNKSSGAYGIGQALGHGHPYNLGDAPAQITWMLDYIAGRYGTPEAAWAHEQADGWYAKGGLLPVRKYDSGGLLPTGASIAVNGTGAPEPVGHGLNPTINVNFNGPVYGDRQALMRAVRDAAATGVARMSGNTRGLAGLSG